MTAKLGSHTNGFVWSFRLSLVDNGNQQGLGVEENGGEKVRCGQTVRNPRGNARDRETKMEPGTNLMRTSIYDYQFSVSGSLLPAQ